MNALQKASVSHSIKSCHLSFTEASLTAIALTTAVVLQTLSQSPQLSAHFEYNLSSLAVCKADQRTVSR